MTESTPASIARQPTSALLLNGVQVPCISWEVTSNGYYRADSFSASIPVGAMPLGLQAADMATLAQIDVEVRAAVDGSSPTSLIIGRVDDIEEDFGAGTIHLTGRDRTADFIEAKTAEVFRNQTASQVVQTLAARHGMTASVTATSTLTGRYYEQDHDRLTDEVTEWDLITYLAEKEGYSAWVSGTVLNFQPVDQVVGTPIPIMWTPGTASWSPQAPFVSLKGKRNLTLAADVTVIVWSWNHKQKTAFKVTAKATKTQKSQSSGGTGQVYTYRVPGLTKDQAQQYALAKAEEISRHEKVITIEMAADVTLTPRNQVQLQGTGTAWDQLYWVDEIVRRMSFEEFSQSVTCKNHSPQSIVSV